MARKMKIGVIDVGGGSRDIFGAGVLDACLDENIQFDYCIGISAGSANLASYLAGQRGRNHVFYTEYFFRDEYASVKNMIKKRCYLDLDYVYGTLSNSDGEYPLDFERMMQNPATFLVETCNATTGESIYLEKQTFRKDNLDAFKASSCLPILCRPVMVDGMECFDGGLADSIPIQKAFEDGCDKVILILTRPQEQRRIPDQDTRRAKLLRHRYPTIAKALKQRADRYNHALDEAMKLEKEGKVLILAPGSIEGMKTLSKDKNRLETLYQEGLGAGKRIKSFLEK